VAARHTAEAAEQSATLAIKNKWEDFGAGLVTEAERKTDEPEGLVNDYMIGFRISLPLPFWNKNEGRIQETRAAAQRAHKEVEARVVEAAGEAAGARGEMAALANVIADMDDQLLPKARDLETSSAKFTRQGRGHSPRSFALLSAASPWSLAASTRCATTTLHASVTPLPSANPIHVHDPLDISISSYSRSFRCGTKPRCQYRRPR
jgi:hypothetical protein